MMNMSRTEVLLTKVGEMMDMIACLSIYNGAAEPKERKKTYDEVMSLR